MYLRSLPLIRSLVSGAILVAFSLAAQAFEAVDVLLPSSSGRYPAYVPEGLPPSLLWVQGGAMLDSNILRRAAAPPTETVLRAGVGGRKDTYVYGRQMLRLEGRVDGYLFNRFSDLNNIGYGGLGEWHWALGRDLDGVLGVSQRRHQRELSQTGSAVQDMVTETRYVANGAYALGPSFRVRAGADLAEYRDPLFRGGNVETAGAFGGLDYVTGLGNTLGIEYRQARGDAPISEIIDPAGLFTNNRFDERTVSLTAGYINPFFRLRGRVGRTKRTYTQLPGLDFNGTTWRASGDWLVTAKTALGLETYYEPRSVIDIGASDVRVRGIAFGPGWAPTVKLNFSARVMRERQDYGGETFAVAGLTPLRLETVRLVRLGAYWEYTRQIHWQFAIDHGTRDSNVATRNYKYNALVANVRYLFW